MMMMGHFRDRGSNNNDSDDDNDILSKRKRDDSTINTNTNITNSANSNNNDDICNASKKRSVISNINENNSKTFVNTSPNYRSSSSSSSSSVFSDRETDPHKIAGRLKQIQFGKNTKGYDNYIMSVPINQRLNNPKVHPRTPDAYLKQSKRAFDGRLHIWRRLLHDWDNKGINGNIFGQDSSIDSIVQTHKNGAAAITLWKQTALSTDIDDLLDNLDYMKPIANDNSSIQINSYNNQDNTTAYINSQIKEERNNDTKDNIESENYEDVDKNDDDDDDDVL